MARLFAHPMVISEFLNPVLCKFGHRPVCYNLPKTQWKSSFFPTYATNKKRPYRRLMKILFFVRTQNLKLSLGVFKPLAIFKLKYSYFVLNFFVRQ